MKTITVFRKTDIAIQLILLPICLSMIDGLGPFLYGFWQVLSDIINLNHDSKNGGVSTRRKIYSAITLVVVIVFIYSMNVMTNVDYDLDYQERIKQTEFAWSYVVSMVVMGPALALFYLIISFVEVNRAEGEIKG